VSAPASQRALLERVAERAMRERGMEPDFPPAAIAEANAARVAPAPGAEVRDLRDRLWCSIDNASSRDLDQLTFAEPAGAGTRVLVAIADVAATVAPGSALDAHASVNTTSIYTPARTYSMLPERLSTDLTALVQGEERLALVVEYVVDPSGASL
jgi:exoribonuclease-2